MNQSHSSRPFTNRGLLILLATVAGQPLAWSDDVKPARPNVILMMADDMGWGDPSYQGNQVLRTPNLDKMAEAGLRFNRFYAAAPVCSPTRGSCLTGRHPYRYGILFANRGHMLPQEITLAEILSARGYATGHFGKWHLGTLTKTVKESNRGGPGGAKHFSPPEANGFQENFSTEAKVPTWDPLLRPKSVKGRTWWDPVTDNADAIPYGTNYWSRGKIVKENLRGDDSRVIMDRAIQFVQRSAEQKKPFFAVIWFHAPHLPVVAGPEFTKPYAKFSKHAQHYFGCLAAMDLQIGKIRAALRDAGVAGNTMLWFCSDNGPEGKSSSPGTAGRLRGRKRSLYEGGVRVPGILEWPEAISKARVTDVPACTSDYLPTVLDVLGIDMPDQRPLDGVSLKPLIEGNMKARPEPIAFESGNMVTLCDNRFKIVGLHRSSSKKKNPEDKAPASFALYDLEADPNESTDISKEHPKTVALMVKKLAQWRESCNRSRAGADY